MLPFLAASARRGFRLEGKGNCMTLAEFERRITDAAEALSMCAQEIKKNDSFAVEASLSQVLKDLSGCTAFARKWADEQEAEIAKVEESREYEILKKGE
jgi:hypothetical protein